MTADATPTSHPEHESIGLARYRELLGPAERRSLFVAGVVARIPLAIVGYSVLFFVQSTSGSFATAGFASGLAIAAMAVVSPFFGRVADRRGQRGALILAAVAHPVAIALLIALGALGAALPFVGAAAVLVGASIAPVGAFMRARWAGHLGDGPLLHVAFSLEAIADELVWVFGPAVAALVAGTVNSSAGLVLSGVLGTLGAVWLLRGAGIAPAVAASALPTDPGVPALPAAAASAADTRRQHGFRPWRSPRLVAVLFANAALGVMFGVNDVSVVSWTTDVGVAQIAGLVLTVYSIGSVTGGFLMGLVPSRIPGYRLLVFAALFVGASWAALSLAPSPYWLFPIGFFAGAAITPWTISTNRVLHAEVSPAVFTEALAWVSAFLVGAMAVGSYVGGLLAEGVAPDAGFRLLAFGAFVPLVIIALGGVRPRRPWLTVSRKTNRPFGE